MQAFEALLKNASTLPQSKVSPAFRNLDFVIHFGNRSTSGLTKSFFNSGIVSSQDFELFKKKVVYDVIVILIIIIT